MNKTVLAIGSDFVVIDDTQPLEAQIRKFFEDKELIEMVKAKVSDTCTACTSDGCKECTINPGNQTKADESAVGMLEEAAECIGDRASERDTEAERSMAATIRAFNGMYGTELTEEQGWQFMVLLKMARAKGGDYRRDDYVDGAAYFALAGECRNDCT